jgi:hypothetical protein
MIHNHEEKDRKRVEAYENSVFTDVGSGRKEKRELFNICYLYSASKILLYDMLIFEMFKKYHIWIQLILGFIIRSMAIFLFAYFIVSQYISTLNTTFISLDSTAGTCVEVPASITGSYLLDINGRWLGNSLYNPSSAYYKFEVYNFEQKTAAYQEVIAQQKVAFSALGDI